MSTCQETQQNVHVHLKVFTCLLQRLLAGAARYEVRHIRVRYCPCRSCGHLGRRKHTRQPSSHSVAILVHGTSRSAWETDDRVSVVPYLSIMVSYNQGSHCTVEKLAVRNTLVEETIGTTLGTPRRSVRGTPAAHGRARLCTVLYCEFT